MRRTRSRSSRLTALVALLALTTLASDLTPPAAAHDDLGHEGVELAAERTGVTFTSTPAEGLTGTTIELSGAECLLAGGDGPGEGVVARFRSDGRIQVYATFPVAGDGSWSGELTIPTGAPVADGWVEARCIYPASPDPVVYRANRFSVTGRGTGTEANPVPPTFNGGIEAYGEYDGQSTCSPSTKPGMAAFIRLVHRHYGGGSLGVGRGCGAGGTSEHKEGRAWDWAMNAGSAGDRARVQALFNWMFATDSRCRRYAIARRLGMMYIIWNHRMFRMYDVDRGWAPYSGSSPHTDHVHFSLTRDGGFGRVSYWNPTFRAPNGWTPANRRVRDVTLGSQFDTVRPLTGDFDGDERSDVLFYDPEAGNGFVGYARADGRFAARQLNPGPGRVPLIGDFNGDCRDDIFWYGPGDVPDRRWMGLPNRRFRAVVEDVPGTFARPLTGDFNGDRADDIIWYGPGPAADALWRGSAYGFVRRNFRMGGNLEPFAGDFDGDRRDDVFWYGPGGKSDRLAFGTARGTFQYRNIGFALVADPLVGDFNGDDRTDIVWYRNGQTSHRVWTGKPSRDFRAYSMPMDRPYALPTVGDFDADLNDDILWHASPFHPNRIWSY